MHSDQGSQGEPSGSVPAASGRRILLVDDDSIQLKLARTHLMAAGFHVDATTSAANAIFMALYSLPDAIISDVVMEEIDGFAFCRMLRSHPELANVPVVLISAEFAEQDDRKLALMVGASGLIERSPDFSREIAAVTEAIAGQPNHSDETPWTTEFYYQRVAHQLTRLLKKSRDAESQSRALIENASDMITLTTPEGVILEANRRTTDILKYSSEQVVGHHIRDFAPPGHAASNEAAYQKLQHHGSGSHVVPIARADGSIVHMSFSGTTLDVNGRPTVLAIGRDVTAEVEIAKKLEASEQKYRSMVDNIPDVLWSMTLQGELVFMSPNVKRTLGMSDQELLAEGTFGWIERIDPAQQAYVRHAFERLLDEKIPFDIEYRWNGADGRLVWIHSRAFLTRSAEGEEHIDGILADVTARKNLEVMLKRSQHVEHIGQFKDGVAHDFNRTVAAMLTHGSFELDDLGETVEQAIMNVIADVHDAMPPTGVLHIETSTERVAADRPAGKLTLPAGTYVVVTGQLVTSPRASPTRPSGLFTPPCDSEGSEVPIERWSSYRVARAGAGFVWIHAQQARSQGFSIYLPMASTVGPTETATTPVEQNAAPKARPTILLVEDNDLLRAEVLRTLAGNGYQVLVARNGDEAIFVAETHHGDIALLLSDVVMPGMNAFHMAHELRRISSSIKVLFMSGYRNLPHEGNGEMRAVPNILQKPFATATLTQRVREALAA